jgi:4-hydroxy-3-polyprenylbenzoate decarboxylase
MAIVPCSMGTIGRVASGISESLLTRTADVMLKEGRPLIVVPRETPLSLIHLENMTALARAGARILPAMPSFYGRPTSIEALIDTVVSRVLDQLGVDNDLARRWGNEGAR